jgi:5'-nucleotidase
VRILLTNDDGIGAQGLAALHDALAPTCEVWVVAPDREQSAASHAITLARPLVIRERRPRWFEVDGTPTDCVYVGLNHLMKDARPDVVCSGINDGPNLGNDVLYSGTVAAAMESAMLGVPGIALSHAGKVRDFAQAARFAPALIAAVVQNPLPRHAILNVNFPTGATTRYAFTGLGKRTYAAEVVEALDPRGRRYWWIGGGDAVHEDVPGSDCNAVFMDNVISVTPLDLDLTDHGLLGALRQWQVPGYSPK